MEKDKWQIDFPADHVIDEQISVIVKSGMPQKRSFIKQVRRMTDEIGMRHIFRDATELFFIAFLLSVVLVGFGWAAYSATPADESGLYALIFILSPVTYLAIATFSYIRLQHNGTYETEMVCKYTVTQLAAFRMFVFSLFCFMLNTILIAFAAFVSGNLDFTAAVLISAASLFLFSVLFLFLMAKTRRMTAVGTFLIAWVGINGLLVIFNKELYEGFLLQVPIYIYLLLISASLFLYVKRLSKLITSGTSKGAA